MSGPARPNLLVPKIPPQQLLPACRHELDTLHRVHPRPPAPSATSPARRSARVNAQRTALRRALLGTQFVLRAHVLCALRRLGAYHRDGQC